MRKDGDIRNEVCIRTGKAGAVFRTSLMSRLKMEYPRNEAKVAEQHCNVSFNV